VTEDSARKRLYFYGLLLTTPATSLAKFWKQRHVCIHTNNLICGQPRTTLINRGEASGVNCLILGAGCLNFAMLLSNDPFYIAS
jgi:hypothetical protein